MRLFGGRQYPMRLSLEELERLVRLLQKEGDEQSGLRRALDESLSNAKSEAAEASGWSDWSPRRRSGR